MPSLRCATLSNVARYYEDDDHKITTGVMEPIGIGCFCFLLHFDSGDRRLGNGNQSGRWEDIGGAVEYSLSALGGVVDCRG